MKNKKKGKEFELSLKIEWVKSYLEMIFNEIHFKNYNYYYSLNIMWQGALSILTHVICINPMR